MRIGITIGDVGGIGPEVALRAATEESEADREFVLFGPEALWRQHIVVAKQHLLPRGSRIVETADPEAGAPAELGRTSARHGAIAMAAIECAVAEARAGTIDALVTAPLSKEGIHLAGSPHPGHTEMLAALCGVDDPTMAFAGGGLLVALATIHVPLRRVFDLIADGEMLLRRARHLEAFVRRLGCERPRVALCGLNPHASEGGLFGDEEQELLRPVVERARAEGMDLSGPWPPDTVFHDARHGRFDAVLALYHDQGLIAVKTLAFDEAVNVTLGLPIVRTSPDHGTAFDLVGRGLARTGSMRAAIRLAARLATRNAASGEART
ncbi:MAG: 4-hydroxythreonine-4-phosphate dehydrogenase PdxA [Candidatus Sumerlaeia bacterium]|nr:4-hydroxythreonine-4-phosphate dehydrogenase PdxA [Candidatus Sumerlaeia bacterium]